MQNSSFVSFAAVGCTADGGLVCSGGLWEARGTPGAPNSAILTNFQKCSKMCQGDPPRDAKLTPRSARFHPAVSPISSLGQPDFIPRSARFHPAVSPISSHGQPKFIPRSAQFHPAVSPISPPGQPDFIPRSAQIHPAVSPISPLGQPDFIPRSARFHLTVSPN